MESGRSRRYHLVMHIRLLSAALLGALATTVCSTASSRPRPNAETVQSWLLQYHAEEFREPGNPEARYAVAYYDLNGDGDDEALVYFESRGNCGSGGCRLYILASQGGVWRRVSGHTASRRPIGVLPTKHDGWRDVSVFVAGGGAESYQAALPFDGKTYPLNPSVPPARRLSAQERMQVLLPSEGPLIPLRPQ